VFDNYAHVAKALDGGVGASLNKILQDKTGCNVLAWPRTSARAVSTPNAGALARRVKGVKLRVLPTPAFIETFKIMGAIPTPIPFGELYTAGNRRGRRLRA